MRSLAVASSAASSVACPLRRHARVSRPGACAPCRPGATARRAAALRVRAKEDTDDAVAGALKTASDLVDRAAELVPESVPRPAAKAGVAIGGAMLIFWLLQQVLSGVVTLALFAGAAYWFITQNGPKDDAIDVTPTSTSSTKPPGKGAGGKDDLDDPLAEARRIMDKYK